MVEFLYIRMVMEEMRLRAERLSPLVRLLGPTSPVYRSFFLLLSILVLGSIYSRLFSIERLSKPHSFPFDS